MNLHSYHHIHIRPVFPCGTTYTSFTRPGPITSHILSGGTIDILPEKSRHIQPKSYSYKDHS